MQANRIAKLELVLASMKSVLDGRMLMAKSCEEQYDARSDRSLIRDVLLRSLSGLFLLCCSAALFYSYKSIYVFLTSSISFSLSFPI